MHSLLSKSMVWWRNGWDVGLQARGGRSTYSYLTIMQWSCSSS